MIIPDCAPELQSSPILRSMRRSNTQVNQLYVTEEQNVLEVTLDAWLKLATGVQRTIHRQQLYGTIKQAGFSITDAVLQIQKFKARMIHRALDPRLSVRNSALVIIE